MAGERRTQVRCVRFGIESGWGWGWGWGNGVHRSLWDAPNKGGCGVCSSHIDLVRVHPAHHDV